MASSPRPASLDAPSARDLSGGLVPIVALLLSGAAALAVIVPMVGPMVGEVGWMIICVPFLLIAYVVVVIRRAERHRGSRRRIR